MLSFHQLKMLMPVQLCFLTFCEVWPNDIRMETDVWLQFPVCLAGKSQIQAVLSHTFLPAVMIHSKQGSLVLCQ